MNTQANGYTHPTITFEVPKNAGAAAILGSMITTFLVNEMDHNPEPFVQPYTEPVRFTGMHFWQEASPTANTDPEDPTQPTKLWAELYTGWFVEFSYNDSMTNSFVSPVYHGEFNTYFTEDY